MPGWTFLRWFGSITSTNPTVSILVDGEKSVWAEFGTTLSVVPASNGAVFIDPPNDLYVFGSSVLVSATPRLVTTLLLGETPPMAI